jgi:uncharacterized protein YndB with AHSA1/START domain
VKPTTAPSPTRSLPWWTGSANTAPSGATASTNSNRFSKGWNHDQRLSLERTSSPNDPIAATRTLVLERHFPHPPEKLWRALTESTLLAQWLLNNDFEPTPGRKFQFRADPVPNWNGLIDCEVQLVDPITRLAYTWGSLGLESVVNWTLTPTDGGTHVRMEHSGFSADQEHAYKGANYGWQRFLNNLEYLLKGGNK